MRITDKLIHEVVSSVAGEDTVPLIFAIKDKKNVSEFKIAEMLKEQINITRNMLYRLLDQNLVNFIRKKDRQKGWYIYYWTFNPKEIRFLTIKLQKQRLHGLIERLEREQSAQFFNCPQECIRLDFERAMNFEFKCPECGSIIEQHDNAKDIEDIKKKIIEVEDFLKIELAPLPVKSVKAEKEKVSAKKAKIKKEAKSKTIKKPKKKKAVKKVKKAKVTKKPAKPKTVKKAVKKVLNKLAAKIVKRSN
ncbi:hypothetical protein J4418_01825 [Candidatus Woesearchaeota archaeon]|nr:hypothetical protein [Candidatus Woesearchaeota archaeon]